MAKIVGLVLAGILAVICMVGIAGGVAFTILVFQGFFKPLGALGGG